MLLDMLENIRVSFLLPKRQVIPVRQIGWLRIWEVLKHLALLPYMWVTGVWYGSSRVTGPQASMMMASAASALWKP